MNPREGSNSLRQDWLLFEKYSHHTVGFTAVQVPYRELALLVEDVHHSIDEVHVSFSLEYAIQRHSCPVGVPKGEDRVAFVSRLNPARSGIFHKRVLPIHVIDYIGVY